MYEADKIDQFMWGYQRHFRIELNSLAVFTLDLIAPDLEPRALLVGIRRSSCGDHPVCVEPEDGPYDVSLFRNIETDIQRLYDQDPRQNMLYGDEPSMKKKPTWMRQTATRNAIRDRLRTTDEDNNTTTFAGTPTIVGNYDVVPILQVKQAALRTYPRLTKRTTHDGLVMEYSLVHATITTILEEATKNLEKPEPGSGFSQTLNRDPTDILRQAGRTLMSTPAAATYEHGDLFTAANLISALHHERAESQGSIIIARDNHPAVKTALRFTQAIPLRDPRWARKALQLTRKDLALISDSTNLLGLGTIKDYDPTNEDLFTIDFIKHYTWDLRHHGTTLLRTAYGIPGLPKKPLSEADFRSRLHRRVQHTTDDQASKLWTLIDRASRLGHGTTIVISNEAPAEATRLETQGTPTEPIDLDPELLQAVSHIDGAIILDQNGTCHAIGVILDGPATPKGIPARGARYNASIRYTTAHPDSLAIVVSDDGTVDLVPNLREQIPRSTITRAIAKLHDIVTGKEELRHGHDLRNLFDYYYRFYLNPAECKQVNEEIAILKELTINARRLWIETSPFTPDPDMNESYYLPES
jgi:hypothetical protein